MKYKGKIIDAHMHLWDYKSGNYPWLDSELPGADKMLGDYKNLRRNYLVSDYMCDTNEIGVDESVHIQVFGYPNKPSLETAWLSSIKSVANFPSRIVGYVDLSAETVEKQLEEHMQHDGFCGIRNVLCYHTDPDLQMIQNSQIFSEKKWQSGFSKLVELGLTFDTQIFDMQIPNFIEFLRKYPNAKVIINHLAWPTDFSREGFKSWVKHIEMLKPFKNIYIKISAIGCVFKKLDNELIAPYIDELINMLGVERCCLGSNFPVDRLFFSFKELFNFYDELLLNFSFQEKERLFYKNTQYFYSI